MFDIRTIYTARGDADTPPRKGWELAKTITAPTTQAKDGSGDSEFTARGPCPEVTYPEDLLNVQEDDELEAYMDIAPKSNAD